MKLQGNVNNQSHGTTDICDKSTVKMVITLWTVFPNFRFFPLLERIKMAIFRKFEIVLNIDLIMEVLNIGCRKFLVLNLLKIE